MRIISKQKDYYDYSASYGVDMGIVYNRNNFFVKGFDRDTNKFLPEVFYNRDYKNRDVYYRMFVAIAGVVYDYYIKVDNDGRIMEVSKKLFECCEHRRWFMSKDDVRVETQDHVDFFKNLGSPLVFFGIKPIINQDGSNTIKSVVFDKSAITFDAPIFKMIGINDFFDANQVFMNISNFIMSTNSPNIVEINNNDKIVKAGFDLKQSFRGK